MNGSEKQVAWAEKIKSQIAHQADIVEIPKEVPLDTGGDFSFEDRPVTEKEHQAVKNLFEQAKNTRIDEASEWIDLHDHGGLINLIRLAAQPKSPSDMKKDYRAKEVLEKIFKKEDLENAKEILGHLKFVPSHKLSVEQIEKAFGSK